MNIRTLAARSCLIVLACGLLWGCSAAQPKTSPGEVEDIKPGQESIIQAPSQSAPARRGVEERSL